MDTYISFFGFNLCIDVLAYKAYMRHYHSETRGNGSIYVSRYCVQVLLDYYSAYHLLDPLTTVHEQKYKNTTDCKCIMCPALTCMYAVTKYWAVRY